MAPSLEVNVRLKSDRCVYGARNCSRRLDTERSGLLSFKILKSKDLRRIHANCIANCLAFFRRLFARWREDLNRQLERPLLLRIQRANAHDLPRDLLAFSAEYR